MKLNEYASKKLFSEYNIPLPESTLTSDSKEAGEITKLYGTSVIKAQVLTGGRGKAGGIKIAHNPDEAINFANQILNLKIKGLQVEKLLIEEYKKPQKEMYLGITIDRKAKCPVIIGGKAGGVDIEDSPPETIFKLHINPLTGIHEYQARRIGEFLDSKNTSQIADISKKLYKVFWNYDCTLCEINPLALTSDGVIGLDAKVVIDDNALFRQNLKQEETNSLEEEAAKHGMSYVELDGTIGCIVNGAGLAMATLDMIKSYGGEPSNFMDVRAGANAEQLKIALLLISSKKSVKAIVINIFGGITKCDEVAKGISEVVSGINMPIVIRLIGTNENEGKEILKKYGIYLASSTEEAAKKVVALEHSNR